MAVAVPLWLLGKNQLYSIEPITINTTTGVLSYGSAVSMFGVLDPGSSASVQNAVNKVDISPSDNPYMNKVIIEQGSSMTLTEIVQAATPSGTANVNTGIVPNAIEFLVATTFHYRVTAIWKDPAGTTKRTNVGQYQYNGHGERYSKGDNRMTLDLETFSTMTGGVYQANPVLS